MQDFQQFLDQEAKKKRKRHTGRVGFDPALTGLSRGHPVMIYDGACNLCHGWVQFALKRDKKSRLKFLAAQSDLGQEFLKRNRLPAQVFDSFYLVEDAVIHHKSIGFFRMAQYLHWPWPWIGVFSMLPGHLMDQVYDWIARNRYRWFGQRDLCLVADAARPERFL